jgi:hypothetical protein
VVYKTEENAKQRAGKKHQGNSDKGNPSSAPKPFLRKSP